MTVYVVVLTQANYILRVLHVFESRDHATAYVAAQLNPCEILERIVVGGDGVIR